MTALTAPSDVKPVTIYNKITLTDEKLNTSVLIWFND